ncbi:MAG: NepR family anti-sigma factor [Pseudomonadota bacterium]
MGITSDYGHSGSGIFPSAWNEGEDRLVDNKSRRKATKLSDTNDPEFDSLTAALRKMHDSIASEPVPDDFLDLLDQIDAKMSATKKFL